ncbi:TonB-dependent receptor [Ilyomonas limi]|uniref:TonB-dependent receptor n=1 Tax=Ilyomonas limi TaxID=2575867 RepID=A0A4V5UU23_9BACT|nr:TonB-dependent receptor [Ilyomonas limi]TKK67413.1 TonB-dependent receptor [Ilyomonas limi]
MKHLYVNIIKQKKFAFLSLLLLLFFMPAWAQEKTVTGRTTDASLNPLANVSVQVKGSNSGTVTDAAGQYSITVPSSSSILVFSYTGMQTQEIQVNDRTTIDVQMTVAADSLGEVVVIGYGTAKKSDLTGAVATVKAEKLLDRPVTDVSQALQGRVAGVDVSINTSAPGEPAKVRIRGNSSINSSLEPLYVVDGVIGVDATSLNPNDIASLEVLKDASSTAIYGARGANGVIIITTKRGIKGRTRISYDGYVSQNSLQRHLEALDANEFMQVYKLAYANTAKYDSIGYAEGKYVPVDPASLPNLFDANGNPLYNTNWESEVYKTSYSQSHQLTLQGGSDKSVYSASLGVLDQNGLMIESWFNRYSARFTMDNDVKKWLKIGGSLSLVQSKERMVSDANGGLNVSRMVIEALPILPVKYPDGTWAGNSDFPGMEGGSNPVNIAKNRYTLINKQHSLGNVYALFHITRDLDFRSDFGFDLNSQKNNFYSGRELSSLSANQRGVASINNWQRAYWQSENYLTWNKQINSNQRLTALVGLSWQKYSEEYSGASTSDFIDDYWAWHNLGAGTGQPGVGSSDYQWTMNSYFARLTYNIGGKYLFTATGRYDGSSKFGENNKYAFFPSVGAAWNISEENFLKDNPTISLLKVRASYGSTGNQEIGTYNSIQLLASGTTIFDGTRQPTVYRASFGNPDLKWERNNQFDAGLELGLFKNRINLTVDYYRKVTKDMLLAAPIAWTSGLESVFQNIGSVENKGFEFSLNTVNVNTKDFGWTTSIIASTNKSKILQLGKNNDDIYPGPWFLGQTNILRVGWPIGTFWGYEREGVWGTKDAAEAAKYNLQPGDLKWKDQNNDGKIDDADNVRLGQAFPKWTGDIVNTLNYKNFDFTFDIRFVLGVNTVANFKHSTQDRQAIANSLASVLDAWTPENQDSKIAEVRYYGAFYQTHIDSWWVENGAFVRGQNFVLGYTLPSALTDRWKIDRLRFYASAQNLFLITKYSGYDPEVTTFGGNLTQNQDFFPYPHPRVINLGVNLSF